MKIKGTMIIDHVRLIRANKDKDYGEYLTDEDWEIINGKVLPSNWYPYESFRRIAYASFMVIGQADPENARTFGRFAMRNMVKVYKTLLVPGDPVASVEKLAALRRTFYDGDIGTQLKEKGENWLIYEIKAPKEETDRKRWEAYTWHLSGNLEELVEQSGGKDVQSSRDFKGETAEIKVAWKQ